MAERPRRTPEPMGETVRHLGHRARALRAQGDRRSRIGVLLILAGALILVIAVIGAIVVNL